IWKRALAAGLTRRKQRAGIEQVFRVQRLLQPMHEVELDRAFRAGEKIALQAPDAVFGGDRTSEPLHDPVYGRVHRLPLREIGFRIRVLRLADVEMHVAVAEMAERAGTAAGDEIKRGLRRGADEI